MNNPTDLISRASVLELLNRYRERYTHKKLQVITLEEQVISKLILEISNMEIVQPPETSLEKELEGLPEMVGLFKNFTKSRVTYFCRGRGKIALSEYETAFYDTPIEAVLALKEALNSDC